MSQTTQFPPTAKSVPGWTEDPNSPIDSTGTSSETISLSQTYGLVLVLVERSSLLSGAEFKLRVNNDSGLQYDSITTSGTLRTSADSWILAEGSSNDGGARGRLELTGESDGSGQIHGRSSLAGATSDFDDSAGEVLEYAGNTGDLSSLTFFSAFGDFDLTARVYGITL